MWKSKRKFIIQINVSATSRFKGKENERLVYEIELREKNLNIPDVYNSEIIYDINLEYLKNNLYNKKKITKKEKNLLLFIERNKNELDKLFGGDRRMKNILSNIKSIGYLKDKMFAFEYDREAFRKQVEKEAREEAIEEAKIQAKKEGIEQGIEQNKIEIAKSLLESSMSLDEIKKHTGLSLEEIEKLKNDLI